MATFACGVYGADSVKGLAKEQVSHGAAAGAPGADSVVPHLYHLINFGGGAGRQPPHYLKGQGRVHSIHPSL